MQILRELWMFRAYVVAFLGLAASIYAAYFIWQQLKRAGASARKSNRKFHAQTEVVRTEDLPELGVEASVRRSLCQK